MIHISGVIWILHMFQLAAWHNAVDCLLKLPMPIINSVRLFLKLDNVADLPAELMKCSDLLGPMDL